MNVYRYRTPTDEVLAKFRCSMWLNSAGWVGRRRSCLDFTFFIGGPATKLVTMYIINLY